MKRKLDTSALIQRSRDIDVDLEGATEASAIERIKELRSTLRDIHQKSADKRQEMLLNQANFAEDVDETAKVRYLRNIRRSEKQARAFSQLKYRRERANTSGGINRLEIPRGWPSMDAYNEDVEYDLTDPKKLDKDDPSVWRQINCPTEIEFIFDYGTNDTSGKRRRTKHRLQLKKEKRNSIGQHQQAPQRKYWRVHMSTQR